MNKTKTKRTNIDNFALKSAGKIENRNLLTKPNTFKFIDNK